VTAEVNRKILIIDDDPMVCKIVKSMIPFESESYLSSQSFRSSQQSVAPLAVLVDINLGKDDRGLDLIPDIRRSWPYTAIIVITGDTTESHVSKALAQGANDFIRKPLSDLELVARLKVRVQEMHERIQGDTFSFGDVTLNTKLRQLSNGSNKCNMSPSSVDLLSYLFRNAGLLVTRDEMRANIWGALKVSDSAVDKKIFEVRKALKDVESKIDVQSHYGEGLRLLADF